MDINAQSFSAKPAPISWELFELQRRAAERSSVPTALILTASQDVVYVNLPLATLLGVSAWSVENRPFYQLFDDPEPVEALLALAFGSGTAQAIGRVPFTNSSGRSGTVTLVASPFLDGRGNPQGMVVHLVPQEDSELAEANAKLVLAGLRELEAAERDRRNAAQTTALLENMTEGISVFDAEGRLMMVNPVGRSILGFEETVPTLESYRRCDFRKLDESTLEFEQ